MKTNVINRDEIIKVNVWMTDLDVSIVLMLDKSLQVK